MLNRINSTNKSFVSPAIKQVDFKGHKERNTIRNFIIEGENKCTLSRAKLAIKSMDDKEKIVFIAGMNTGLAIDSKEQTKRRGLWLKAKVSTCVLILYNAV